MQACRATLKNLKAAMRFSEKLRCSACALHAVNGYQSRCTCEKVDGKRPQFHMCPDRAMMIGAERPWRL